MSFLEFFFLFISASAITLGLMLLGEKLLRSVSSKTINPVLLSLGSLGFTYSVLLFTNYLLAYQLHMTYFLLAGMIIILNKYWLGHFSQSNEEMKAFPLHGERFAK